MECHFSNISGRMLWNEKDTLVQFGKRTYIHYSWHMMCCISHVFSHRMSTFVFSFMNSTSGQCRILMNLFAARELMVYLRRNTFRLWLLIGQITTKWNLRMRMGMH